MADASTEDKFYDQLSIRVQEIAKEHSQQLIASRTATPKQTVSRYVAGGRPSPWFLHSLVRGFGINPSWMLMGEGTKLLTDVTADTSRMAGNLLDLVKAMGAVTERKLGSLVGKQHLMVLRELNDALVSLETIQERVSKESESTFRKIIEDLGHAVDTRQFDRMEALIRTGRQVSRLSFNRELQREFKALMAISKAAIRDFEGTLPLYREALFEHIAAGQVVDPFVLERVSEFARILSLMQRLPEARNVCNAFLSLARGRAPELPEHRHLESQAASLDIECGDLEAALPKIAAARAWSSEEYRNRAGGFGIALSLFYTGSMRFGELKSLSLSEHNTAHVPNSLALWTADAEHLQSVIAFNAKHLTHSHTLLDAYARITLNAMLGNMARALTEADALTPENIENDVSPFVRRFTIRIVKAQAARLAKNVKVAKEEALLAEDVLRSGEPDLMPILLFRAMHWRNVLLLFDQPSGAKEKRMVERARAQVTTHLQRGYGMLRELVDKVTPATAT